MIEILSPTIQKQTSIRVTNQTINDLAYWERLFQQMNFPGMDLVEATAYPITILDKVSRIKQFGRVKRDFLKYLAYNSVNDLRAAGLTEEDIFFFKKGIMPENFTVHLKIPFDYTGDATFPNMVLMQNVPFHEDIHRFMDMQMAGMEDGVRPTTLYIPVPTGKIYIPMTLYTGSGGKGKHDRSVYAGFSEGTFKTLAQKAMPGR